jgi:glutamate dehydrogenase
MASTTVVPETPVRGPDDGPSAGTLTELAALEAARDEKRQLLARAADAARSAKRELPTGCTPDDLPALLQRYYWSEPAAEVVGHEPAELADLALGHLRLAEVRPPGSATVDAQHLADGRAVIRLVTDDMPYLVDSVTAEVVRQGFALAHIVHPVVVVRRDLRGQILAFCDSSLAVGCGSDALT